MFWKVGNFVYNVLNFFIISLVRTLSEPRQSQNKVSVYLLE